MKTTDFTSRRRLHILQNHLTPNQSLDSPVHTHATQLKTTAIDSNHTASTHTASHPSDKVSSEWVQLLIQHMNPFSGKQRLWSYLNNQIRPKIEHMIKMEYNEQKLLADRVVDEIIRSEYCIQLEEAWSSNPEHLMNWMENFLCEGSIAVKLSVHFNLFMTTINLLGEKYHHDMFMELHQKALSSPNSKYPIGCFMLTELSHGSDAKNIKTEFRYNREKDCFILNSLGRENMKYWIGNALISARFGIVLGQLIVNDENHGVHAFVVELRDEEGNIKEGISIRDTGFKHGLNALDNGRVMFADVLVNKKYLLSRYARISENGEYQSSIKNKNIRFVKHISALLLARIGVSSAGVSYAKTALAIAIRYAYSRSQFVSPETKQEIRLMEYPLHRKRLIPLLAETYASSFFQLTVKDKFIQYSKETNHNMNQEQMKEIHLLASVAKAILSWLGNRAIQASREACGGQGYAFRNRIAQIRSDADIMVTLDGDNHLLLQQIAQIVLEQYTEDLNSRNFVSRLFQVIFVEKLSDFFCQGLIFNYYSSGTERLRDVDTLLSLLKYRYERQMHTLGARLYQRIVREKMSPLSAFNSVQVHACEMARSYSTYLIASTFKERMTSLFSQNKKDLRYKGMKKPLKLCLQLYCLSSIEETSWFLEHSCYSSGVHKAIRKETHLVIDELSEFSRDLVDGFGLPETILDDTIGSKTRSLVDLNPMDSDVL